MHLKLNAYLQLIGFKNILLLAFAQFLLFQAIVGPILQIHGFDYLRIDLLHFLLIFSTASIFAGASIVNHYFDMKIDAINKPDQRIIGVLISKKSAMIFYQIVTSIGLFGGLTLAYLSKSYGLAFIFLLIPGLIWFYASNYKRQGLLGNLIFAFIISLSVFVVAISEVSFLELRYKALIFETNIPIMIYYWLLGYALLAFFLALILSALQNLKELVGARELEWRTIAVCWGVKWTKRFLYVLIALSIALFLWIGVYYIPFEGSLPIRYILFGQVLPLLFLAYSIFRAERREGYKTLCSFLKLIFLLAILSCPVFYYLYAKAFGISLFGLFLVQ